MTRIRRVTATFALGLSSVALTIAACGGSAAPASAPAIAPSSVAPSPTVAPSSAPTLAPTLAPTPSPSASPAAATPAAALGQTGRIVVADQGFAITLPNGWTRIPLDPAQIAVFARQFPPNSAIAELLTSQAGQAAATGIKLWAFDLTPKSATQSFTANLNVIVQPAPIGLSAATLKAIAVGQLEFVHGITNVAATVVQLPVGEAVRLTYQLDQALASGTKIRVAGTQYYLVGPKHLYIATFFCAGATATACRSSADRAIRTFAYISG